MEVWSMNNALLPTGASGGGCVPGSEPARLGAVEVADALGVSRAAVSHWLAAARQGGPDALSSRLRVGPAGKLLPGQSI